MKLKRLSDIHLKGRLLKACSFWLPSEDSVRKLGDFSPVTKAGWEECLVRIGNFGKE